MALPILQIDWNAAFAVALVWQIPGLSIGAVVLSMCLLSTVVAVLKITGLYYTQSITPRVFPGNAMKKIQFFITALFVFSLILSTASVAQLYKWVDDQGKVHYGDSPPENADLKEITGEVSSFTSVTVEPFKFDPSLITQPTASKSVIMYSTTWCGYCKKAKRHFKKNNISFKEYDIEKSAKAAREYKRLKGRGVPVILIGKRRMNGFSAQAFDKIYYGS